MNPAATFSLPAVLLLALALLAGCSTTPPVDWNSRIGTYTYNQAVAEMGRPDRQASLSDGKMQYKWFIGPRITSPPNTGMSNYGNQGFTSDKTAGAVNNHMLQLTFGPDGKLVSWSRN